MRQSLRVESLGDSEYGALLNRIVAGCLDGRLGDTESNNAVRRCSHSASIGLRVVRAFSSLASHACNHPCIRGQEWGGTFKFYLSIKYKIEQFKNVGVLLTTLAILQHPVNCRIIIIIIKYNNRTKTIQRTSQFDEKVFIIIII